MLTMGTVAVGDANAQGNAVLFKSSDSSTFELSSSTRNIASNSPRLGTIAHDTVSIGQVSLGKQELRTYLNTNA